MPEISAEAHFADPPQCGVNDDCPVALRRAKDHQAEGRAGKQEVRLNPGPKQRQRADEYQAGKEPGMREPRRQAHARAKCVKKQDSNGESRQLSWKPKKSEYAPEFMWILG